MNDSKKGKYQNKSVYLNAALNIIKENGVDKLTMRKVARDLEVSPMAIYKHFTNKEELLKAVLDEFIARADVLPKDELDWEAWLTHVALKMNSTLRVNSNWLPLLGTFEVGENALTISFKVIEKLQQAGFSNQQAVDAYLTMIHLVLGAVSIQAALDKSGGNVVQSTTNQQTFSENPFVDTINKQQIEISLPLLIDGLKRRLAAS